MSRSRATDAALQEQAVPYQAGLGGPTGAPPLTCLDLFCGCGGFSLGMQRAGFSVLAAIDSNPEAVATFDQNFPDVPFVLEKDLTSFGPEELAELISPNSSAAIAVDVIVGGPPCQGFSIARQVDGANHGWRLKPDTRRYLYREFLRYVDFFQPRVFVIENVPGLRNAAGGACYTAVQNEARALGRSQGRPGYRVHGQVEDAWELGVPQKRHRQLIIGVRNDLPGYFLPELKPAPRANPRPCLWDAIGDLPILRAGNGAYERDYDFGRRVKHVERRGPTALRYLCKVLEIDRARTLTGHVARLHSERDLRDFARLKEGENSKTAMRDRGVGFEFPYDKSTFKDRYTRQSRWYPCSTIVAHLSKDGLMFIHPTQNRSLTAREAARVQSFPDWFRFPESRTQAYQLIGNAVPPLVAEAVGLAVKEFLSEQPFSSAAAIGAGPTIHSAKCLLREAVVTEENSAFRSRPAAAAQLQRLAALDRRALRLLPKDAFLRGWHALLFLFPELHPDNALDHGETIEAVPPNQLTLPGFEQLAARRYVRSGWPVALELLGREAWRRFEAGDIGEQAFYCVEAQRAGFRHSIGAQSLRLERRAEKHNHSQSAK
ncbi:MAG: DNA cytosine methyltransferase [Verrucomicrobiota bacterium]|jgi:DNA (cytosine-5)-methyltransferase 1